MFWCRHFYFFALLFSVLLFVSFANMTERIGRPLSMQTTPVTPNYVSGSMPMRTPFQDPVKSYFAVDVCVQKAIDKNGSVLNVSSRTVTKLNQRWEKRKNKNPLKTRLTVRELKNVIEQHKQLMNVRCTEKDNTSSNDGSNDIVIIDEAAEISYTANVEASQGTEVKEKETKSDAEETKPNNETGNVNDHQNGVLEAAWTLVHMGADGKLTATASNVCNNPLIMPNPRYCRRRPTRNTTKSSVQWRAKGFDLKTIEMGRFMVSRTTGDEKMQMKVHYANRTLVYELYCDYIPLELRTDNGIPPPVIMHFMLSVFIPFADILGFYFDHNQREICLRMRQAPVYATRLMGIQARCELMKNDHSVQAIAQTPNWDVTDGNIGVLFHKLSLNRNRGAVIQHSLLEFDVAFFEPLMKSLPDLMDFGPTVVPFAAPTYLVQVGPQPQQDQHNQQIEAHKIVLPENEDQRAVMQLMMNQGQLAYYEEAATTSD